MELIFTEGVRRRNMPLEQFVALTSTWPSKLFGLYPQKGTIKEGSDADIVIFDPNKHHIISDENHHMSCDYSAYNGIKLEGQCIYTIFKGQIVVKNKSHIYPNKSGSFLKRKRPTFTL